jgi:hypothetical protein
MLRSVPSGTVYEYDVDGTTAATVSDLIALTSDSGVLTLGGDYTLNVTDLSGGLLDPTGKTFNLISYLGDDPGAGSLGNWTINLPAGWSGGVIGNDTDGNFITLSGITAATAVPEPATLALLALGGLCLVGGRRRKQV